jgi:hypothetical protein
MVNNIQEILRPKNEVVIGRKIFRIHPVYDLYGSNNDGYVSHIVNWNPMRGFDSHRGYFIVSVRKDGCGNRKSCAAHRFIWECHHGIINDGMTIDHINNNRFDNRLHNLQLVTKQYKKSKSAKNRDYSFVANNHKNKKCVRAVNWEENTESFYDSLSAVKQHLNINPGIVKMACEGLNHVKFGISKKNGCRYKFNYISKEELPEDHKRCANKRPKKKKKEDNQE